MIQNEKTIKQRNHITNFDISWPRLPIMTPIPSLVLVSFPMPMKP
jgi:hypothetical protein